MLSESWLCPRLPPGCSGGFLASSSSPGPAAGARLPALGLEPATPAPPPRPSAPPAVGTHFPGERGLPSHPVSTSRTRMWTSIVRKAVSGTVDRLQKEGAERVRLKEKGAGVEARRPAGWCLGIPTWTPAARRLWDKKPSKCTCSLFLCERRSQGCNICVPCPRRNSDFLKPAKCPESVRLHQVKEGAGEAGMQQRSGEEERFHP